MAPSTTSPPFCHRIRRRRRRKKENGVLPSFPFPSCAPFGLGGESAKSEIGWWLRGEEEEEEEEAPHSEAFGPEERGRVDGGLFPLPRSPSSLLVEGFIFSLAFILLPLMHFTLLSLPRGRRKIYAGCSHARRRERRERRDSEMGLLLLLLTLFPFIPLSLE